MNEPVRPTSGPRTPPTTSRAHAEGPTHARKDARVPIHPGFRERLHALAPAIHPAPPKAAPAALGGGMARPSPRTSRDELELPARATRTETSEPTRRDTTLGTAEPDLAPFRVGPSILSAPMARAVAEPTPIDPSQLGAELLESMRLGRFGRDGHAVTMRVRGRTGSIDVDLREEDGRLALRVSGDDLERTNLADRVRRDLAERGIEIDVVG